MMSGASFGGFVKFIRIFNLVLRDSSVLLSSTTSSTTPQSAPGLMHPFRCPGRSFSPYKVCR